MENNGHVHETPEPSFWPLVLAVGLLLIAIGVIYSLIISAVGVIILLFSLSKWSLENRKSSLDEEDEDE